MVNLQQSFLQHMTNFSDRTLPCNVGLDRIASKREYRPYSPSDEQEYRLYIAESNLRTRDDRGGYTRLVGMGLFTSQFLSKKSFVASFKGTVINTNEKQRVINEGKGGYIIQLKDNVFLDCYKYRNECYSSKVNEPYYAVDITVNKKATANLDLKSTCHGASLGVKKLVIYYQTPNFYVVTAFIILWAH